MSLKTFKEWIDDGNTISASNIDRDLLVAVQQDDSEEIVVIATLGQLIDYILGADTVTTWGNTENAYTLFQKMVDSGIKFRTIQESAIEGTIEEGDVAIVIEEDESGTLYIKYDPSKIDIGDLDGTLNATKVVYGESESTVSEILTELLEVGELQMYVTTSSSMVLNYGTLEQGETDTSIISKAFQVENAGDDNILIYYDAFISALPWYLSLTSIDGGDYGKIYITAAGESEGELIDVDNFDDDGNLVLGAGEKLDIYLTLNASNDTRYNGVIIMPSDAEKGTPCLSVQANITPSISDDDIIYVGVSSQWDPNNVISDYIAASDSTALYQTTYGDGDIYDDEENLIEVTFGNTYGGIALSDNGKYHVLIYPKNRGLLSTILQSQGGSYKDPDYLWKPIPFEITLYYDEEGNLTTVETSNAVDCYAYRTYHQIVNAGNINRRTIQFTY